jgi:post-segregation antitoxin (ccd killing protein)
MSENLTVLGIDIPTKTPKGTGKKVYIALEGDDAQLVRDLKSRGVDVTALTVALLKKAFEALQTPQQTPQNNGKK